MKKKILKREKKSGTNFIVHFGALQAFLQDEDGKVNIDSLQWWAKFNLTAFHKGKLGSCIGEIQGDISL